MAARWLSAPPDEGEYCEHCEHWGCACMWYVRGDGGAAGPFSARELRWLFLYGTAGGEGTRAFRERLANGRPTCYASARC